MRVQVGQKLQKLIQQEDIAQEQEHQQELYVLQEFLLVNQQA